MSEQKFDFQNIDLKLYLTLRNICKDYLSLCEDAGGVMDSPPKEYVDAQLALAEFELSHGPLPNWAIARNWDYSLLSAQPAPAQDVAGLVEAAKKADDALSALVRNDQPLETLTRKYGSDWSAAIDKVRTELVIRIAAHDKQSGVGRE